MKKSLVALLVFALVSPAGISWGAVKAGGKCSKLGELRTVKKLEFTCVKKSGKLVWSKGVQKRFGGYFEPGSSNTATPTPTLSRTPSPSSTGAIPSPSSSAANIDYSSHERAFAEVEKAYKSSNPVKIDFNFQFSSDANKEFGDLLKDTIEKSARLWTDLYNPTSVFPVILGNPKTITWVEKQIGEYGFKFMDYDLAKIRSQGNKLGLGDVRVNGKGAITFYVIGDRYESPPNSSRSFISHEYAHSVQVSLFGSREEGLPHWAIEGGASFFGDAIASIISGGGLTEYQKLRRNSARRDFPNSLALNSLTRNELYEIIKSCEEPRDNNSCAEPKLVSYTSGAILTEKLVADFGFKKFSNWWRVSANKGWYKAFEEVFGINMDAWYQEVGIPYAQAMAQNAIPEVQIPSPNTYTPKTKRLIDPLERWEATGSNALKVYKKWGNSRLDDKPKTKIEYFFSPNFWKDVELVFRARFESVVAYWDRFVEIEIPIYFMAGTKDDVEWICKLLETKDPERRRAAGCIENESQAVKDGFGSARGFDLTNGSANFYLTRFKEVSESASFKPRIEHEYFHSVQQNILKKRFRSNIACWFLEGGSEYFGLLTSTHGDAELFLKLRRQTILGAPERRRPDVTAEELSKWISDATVAWQLSPEAWAENCSPFWRNGLYHDGILATEWLIDRIGVDGVIALLKDATVTSWTEAFEKRVGLPIKESNRLIGEYMLKERLIAQENSWMSILFCNNAGNPGPAKSPPGCWFW